MGGETFLKSRFRDKLMWQIEFSQKSTLSKGLIFDED
jgi:hypothetical protein